MQPPSVEYIPCELFALSITRFDRRPQTAELRIKSLDQLDEQLRRVEAEAKLAIGLTALDPDECEWGSFWLFINGDRALVHLIEGRCLTARDPAFTGRADTDVEFLDDAGNDMRAASGETLSRSQALWAMRHWMPDGEKLSELSWIRA